MKTRWKGVAEGQGYHTSSNCNWHPRVESEVAQEERRRCERGSGMECEYLKVYQATGLEFEYLKISAAGLEFEYLKLRGWNLSTSRYLRLPEVVMSSRVAGVALCDIRRVPEGVSVRGSRGRKVAVSMGKATKTGRFQGLTQSCNIVASGRRGIFCVCVCESGSRGLKVAVSMGKAAKTCRFQGVMS